MARHSKPWYRKGRGWYVWRLGKLVPLGVNGKQNKAAAVEAWHRLMTEPEAAPPKVNSGPGKTTGELFEAFASDVAKRAKPNTIRTYRYFFGAVPDGPAASLRPADLEAASRRPTWSPSTRHGFYTAVLAAFRWAESSGLLAENPLKGLRRPPQTSRGSKAVWTGEEVERLVANTNGAFAQFLRGLYLTGCRPGELSRLEAKDIRDGMAFLYEHKTDKTGRPRVIYLSEKAAEFLAGLVRERPTGPLLRNTNGDPWKESALVCAMGKARKKAGLPKAICYGFRHTFATDALAAGVPDATVAALLGHAGTAMLHKHYSHLTSRPDVLRKAAGVVR